MPKIHTTITLDDDIVKKAKEKFLNISGLAEQAIKNKLNIKEVQMSNPSECEFCEREGEQENRDTINQKTNGLTWLYPDERWICNKCLHVKSRYIIK